VSDIRPNAIVLNIVLDQRNILINEEGRACLADFGLAVFVEHETSIKSSTRGGSTRWMSPELLLPGVYQPDQTFQRTIESDIWAFACVCCEVRFSFSRTLYKWIGPLSADLEPGNGSICRQVRRRRDYGFQHS
jgi:serine/threonine protein kinase